MATVEEHLTQDTEDTDGRNGQYGPRVFRYVDLLPTEDILALPGIPSQGSVLTVFGRPYFAQRWRVRPITATSGDVEVPYSSNPPETFTGNYKPWSVTYRRVEKALPVFARGQYRTVGRSGEERVYPWWFRQDTQLPINYLVLQVTTSFQSTGLVTRTVKEAIANAWKQVGHGHVLPLFPDDVAVYQPPIFRQVSASRAECDHTWVLDPGNSRLALPNNDDVSEDGFIFPPRRPPWHEYVVIPASRLGDDPGTPDDESRPKIVLDYLFPERDVDGSPNVYRDPEGWRTLPGSPMDD